METLDAIFYMSALFYLFVFGLCLYLRAGVNR